MDQEADRHVHLLKDAQELKMKYDIKEMLGSGTSSTVYRAVNKRTGEEFALKTIDVTGEHGDDLARQVREETRREIDILKLCKGNKNIVQIYEYFETPSTLFLVVELCKHGELFDYLTRVICLSEKKVRLFMKQVLEAVRYIHERNIVHRDLKPENILLIDEFEVKISDFGFGVILGENERLTELCGTPSYLAPEVLARSMYENAPGYGLEVDMWACGVIMYTMLCGAPPFWNRRQMVMIRQIMNCDFSFNNPEWNDVTWEAKNLIQQLLRADPHERLTADDALEHPFFHCLDGMRRMMDKFHWGSLSAADRLSLSAFSQGSLPPAPEPVSKFRVGVVCIRFTIHLLRVVNQRSTVIDMEALKTDPYSIRAVRKPIDAAAFNMYRHWVKKEALQSRAALFENNLAVAGSKTSLPRSSLA